MVLIKFALLDERRGFLLITTRVFGFLGVVVEEARAFAVVVVDFLATATVLGLGGAFFSARSAGFCAATPMGCYNVLGTQSLELLQ